MAWAGKGQKTVRWLKERGARTTGAVLPNYSQNPSEERRQVECSKVLLAATGGTVRSPQRWTTLGLIDQTGIAFVPSAGTGKSGPPGGFAPRSSAPGVARG
jgi:hypothetical protein